MEKKITNKQIKELLTTINTSLGVISVSGNDVFTLAECRNALAQIITVMPIDENTNDFAESQQ